MHFVTCAIFASLNIAAGKWCSNLNFLFVFFLLGSSIRFRVCELYCLPPSSFTFVYQKVAGMAVWYYWLPVVSLCVGVLYRLWLRKCQHYRVNCWFCNQYGSVPYKNRNSWYCRHCEQYNGFTQVSTSYCNICFYPSVFLKLSVKALDRIV